MFCPNCMSPYVEPLKLDPDEPPPEEQMLECTECEYVGVVTEFLPENYR